MAQSPTNEEEPKVEQEKEVNIKILQNTLSPELLKEVIDLTKSAFKTSRVEKDAASTIKKAFDEKIFGSTWHCIIGKHFAVSVQFDTQYFTFFQMDQRYILLVRLYTHYHYTLFYMHIIVTHQIQFKSEN
eukprot:641842_1